MLQFTLASASPRRHMLLSQLNVPFRVQIADVDEDSINDADPIANVRKRAELKAQGVSTTHNTDVILAADTIVVLNDQILNKPASPTEARHMLNQLHGRTHQVHTAITLRHLSMNRMLSAVDTTDVHMRAYTDQEIEAYIATGDPFDKAGSYAIQHETFKPVTSLNGCYLTVMGLSLCHLLTLLQTWDVYTSVTPQLLHELHQGHSCPILNELGL